jgi:foldase protein PrsA
MNYKSLYNKKLLKISAMGLSAALMFTGCGGKQSQTVKAIQKTTQPTTVATNENGEVVTNTVAVTIDTAGIVPDTEKSAPISGNAVVLSAIAGGKDENADGVNATEGKNGTGKTTSTETAFSTSSDYEGGKIEMTLDEMRLYTLVSKGEAKALYGAGVFDLEIGSGAEKESYSDKLKSEIIKQAEYIAIVCAHANEQGVSINGDDQMEIDGKVTEYSSKFADGEMARLGITKDAVEKAYYNNMLATKVYESIAFNVDQQITEEEARVGVFDYIYLIKKKFEIDGSEVKMSDEELAELAESAKEIRKAAVEVVKEDIDKNKEKEEASEDGEAVKYESTAFYNYAKTVSDDTDEVEMTACIGDVKDELKAAVFSLEQNEVSEVIETEDGYFIFFCKRYEDENLSLQKKTEMIMETLDAAFEVKYKEWEATTKIIINKELLDSL